MITAKGLKQTSQSQQSQPTREDYVETEQAEEENHASRVPAVSDRVCRVSEELSAGQDGSPRSATDRQA